MCLFKLIPTLLVLLFPVFSQAAQSNFRTETVLNVFDVPAISEYEDGTPVFNFQAEAGETSRSGLTLHVAGLGQKQAFNYYDTSDAYAGEFHYGFLQFQGERAHFNARFGRQYVYEGPILNLLDGFKLQSELGPYFSGSVFGGLPAEFSSDNDRIGRSTYGGLLTNTSTWHRLDISYQRYSTVDDFQEVARAGLSADLAPSIRFHGQTYFDLISNTTTSHDLKLVLIRDWFKSAQRFFLLPEDEGSSRPGTPLALLTGGCEDFTYVGAQWTAPVLNRFSLIFNVKHYDRVEEENSQYYSTTIRWNRNTDDYVGSETGVMISESDQDEYLLLRLFGQWVIDTRRFFFHFVRSEIMYTSYFADLSRKEPELNLSLDCGLYFFDDSFSTEISGSYSDPLADDESFQTMLRLTYRFGGAI